MRSGLTTPAPVCDPCKGLRCTRLLDYSGCCGSQVHTVSGMAAQTQHCAVLGVRISHSRSQQPTFFMRACFVYDSWPKRLSLILHVLAFHNKLCIINSRLCSCAVFNVLVHSIAVSSAAALDSPPHPTPSLVQRHCVTPLPPSGAGDRPAPGASVEPRSHFLTNRKQEAPSYKALSST